MRLRFALGSWSNRHFEHTLYPLRTPHAQRLPSYAATFSAVELDILHHQEPDAGRLQDWAAQVPPGFTFLPKMHKDVTHSVADRSQRGRPDAAPALSDDDAVQLAGRFLDDLAPLREVGVLGRTLLQFPPGLRREEGFDRLQRLLAAQPTGTLAVEFRHPSWFVPAVEAMLEELDAALVWSTYPGAFAPPWRTASEGYVRFVGKHHNTRGRHIAVDDRIGDILEIRKRLRDASWDTCFVVVTNTFEGNAIDSMPRIAAALGDEAFARRVVREPTRALLE